MRLLTAGSSVRAGHLEPQIKLRYYSSELDYFIYTLNKKYATALELQAPIVIYVKRQITVNM